MPPTHIGTNPTMRRFTVYTAGDLTEEEEAKVVEAVTILGFTPEDVTEVIIEERMIEWARDPSTSTEQQ